MNRAALLLADPSPCLRKLVLTQILGRAEDHAEVQEIRGQCEGDTLVAGLVANQKPNGSWSVRQSYGASAGGSFLATSYALSRLGYLGFGPDFAPVRKGAEYLFSKQRRDGSWPIPQRAVEEQGRYSMVPLQTALPLRGLAASGYARGFLTERGPRERPRAPSAMSPGTGSCPTPGGDVAPTPRELCSAWPTIPAETGAPRLEGPLTSCWGGRQRIATPWVSR
jgi:hypothetical protein